MKGNEKERKQHTVTYDSSFTNSRKRLLIQCKQRESQRCSLRSPHLDRLLSARQSCRRVALPPTSNWWSVERLWESFMFSPPLCKCPTAGVEDPSPASHSQKLPGACVEISSEGNKQRPHRRF